ncbi:MAG: tetratricopeptide repeat protein [Deltaproteobacteria bacterium]|nr:tetratricopeptide repeat protein [Deltaproteobacteria bacterium]
MIRSLKPYSLFISILFATVVSGCVEPLPPRPNSGFTYYPKVQPGIATVEAAKSDLALMLKRVTDITSEAVEVIRDKKKKPYQFANEGELTKLMEEYKGRGGISSVSYDSRTFGLEAFTIWRLLIAGFPVSDDRIEVLFNPPLVYRDLLNDKLVVNVVYGEGGRYDYSINFATRYSFLFGPRDLATAQRFANDLFVIQEHLKKQEQEQTTLFETQATNYRALAVKPAISEAQRKLFVQADALSHQKDYLGAIEFYNKAFEIDPFSYPGAYFNVALLEAQENRFRSAIGSMKKYLLLVPDAKDARSAQDKIYEWELMISRQ